METNKKEENKNLQIIESVDDTLEALRLSPFFVSLSEEDLESMKERIKNPTPIQYVSNRRH